MCIWGGARWRRACVRRPRSGRAVRFRLSMAADSDRAHLASGAGRASTAPDVIEKGVLIAKSTLAGTVPDGLRLRHHHDHRDRAWSRAGAPAAGAPVEPARPATAAPASPAAAEAAPVAPAAFDPPVGPPLDQLAGTTAAEAEPAVAEPAARARRGGPRAAAARSRARRPFDGARADGRARARRRPARLVRRSGSIRSLSELRSSFGASGSPVDRRRRRGSGQQTRGARVREQPIDGLTAVFGQPGRVRVRVKVEIFVDERWVLQRFFAAVLGRQTRDQLVAMGQTPGDARPQHG